jgi:hypothetical protein
MSDETANKPAPSLVKIVEELDTKAPRNLRVFMREQEHANKQILELLKLIQQDQQDIKKIIG